MVDDQASGNVVLACAALGSLAFAGARIAGANARHPTDYAKRVRIYGTTPALAAATLTSLRIPPGFREEKCSGNEGPNWACWSKSPSLPLEEGGMQRLILAMGARQYSAYEATHDDGIPGVQCMRFHLDRRYQLGFQNCQAEVLKGRERLVIFAKSFLLPSRKPTRRVIAEPAWKYPTEISIYVVGHFEREGVRASEEG